MRNPPAAVYGLAAALVYACLVMWLATIAQHCDRAHMTTIPQSCGAHLAEALAR